MTPLHPDILHHPTSGRECHLNDNYQDTQFRDRMDSISACLDDFLRDIKGRSASQRASSIPSSITLPMSVLPSTQSVWRSARKGKPADALDFDENAPVSSNLADGEILVKVDAAALNPATHKFMGLPGFLYPGRGHVAESDLAGTVVLSKSTKHPVGERVFGCALITEQTDGNTREGALAQYTKIPEQWVATVPEGIKMTAIAGLATTGLTAYQCLVQHAKIESGQTIFINGGSSSVGLNCIQIAKLLGCTVWTSTSSANTDLVKKYGADMVLDYKKQSLHEQLLANPPSTKFHAFIDTVGSMDLTLYVHSTSYLQPNGIFVTVMGGPSAKTLPGIFVEVLSFLWARRPVLLGGVNRRWVQQMVETRESELAQLSQWVAEGKLQLVVDSVFEYKNVLQAYDRIMTGRARGKIVVRVNPDAE
ncbi:hypothetical protein BKA62DRAFT_682265 [Auriculariales sp. MPI-PUGE-AT-0066]|nr:hypothetical protein BKA62DRAFT_682265 [Auriculariales sp. MPI-PUGE-AT-0066]